MTALRALFLFAIIFAITRTGSSIQCEVSHSIRAMSKRSTSLQTCGSEFDACGLLVIEATRSGKTVRTVKKSCTTRASCVPGAIFMRLDNGLREAGTSICCTTDRCNAGIPAVPTWNNTLNGLWCPSCSTNHPEPCQRETIRCRGSENKCFLRISGSIVHIGCATESFCANSAQTGITITDELGVLLSSQRIYCIAAYKG
ncbi:phospholipase A2 inhibitor and Ly6/PLAUR domain-containing protein-like [Heteronotia binoei]|uniref:phospholipase A2 inhibitor and Ly6/PLAUR domain-containing protein-like n=1 Tax=Heteronotia binoei TaxID=13085 RepID=UPI00292DACE0|nr:phospholipase A2 inhibitor and Ly6/PLAUR domain-containing protein-like [Heteronotia binoei]